MSDNMPMKRVLFVEEYLKDFNATRAAIAAGYAKKSAHVTACRMLKADKRVQTLIRSYLLKRAEKAGVDVEMVINGLLTEALGQGEDTTSGARTKAWELIGKHLGMFIDRKEIGKPGEFTQMTKAEMEQEIADLLEKQRNSIPGEVVE